MDEEEIFKTVVNRNLLSAHSIPSNEQLSELDALHQENAHLLETIKFLRMMVNSDDLSHLLHKCSSCKIPLIYDDKEEWIPNNGMVCNFCNVEYYCNRCQEEFKCLTFTKSK